MRGFRSIGLGGISGFWPIHLFNNAGDHRSLTFDVDATLISASNSTNNEDKQRDPEMTQTKKGNQWRFGMKAHIGVDPESGLAHTVECTTTKVADITIWNRARMARKPWSWVIVASTSKNPTIDSFEKDGHIAVQQKHICILDVNSLKALMNHRS